MLADVRMRMRIYVYSKKVVREDSRDVEDGGGACQPHARLPSCQVVPRCF